jgi:2-polyprenyl-3-methyl-5-hydroxy-6-metoxy-1,4-benzoquinol methylase
MEEFLYEHFYKIENEHWWFAARQNILREFMEKKLRLAPGIKLLDVGCGTGAILDMFSKRYEAYGQDVSAQAVEFCRKRGLTRVVQGTLDRLPPDYKDFDFATLLDVLEHIDNDRGALREVRSLLKPGGRVLITVPAFPALWGAHDVVTHHKRRYVSATVTEVVTGAGFTVEHISYFNFFLFPVAWVRRKIAKLTRTSDANDMDVPAKPVNGVLRSVFEFEKHLLPNMKFPFGLSLICVARRDA